MSEMLRCTICDRPLDRETDPLSVDCGGDCWGCIGAVEYQTGIGEPERGRVEAEVARGLREPGGDPKPPRCAFPDSF